MRLNEGQPLVMIGDSITVCERKYPYGRRSGLIGRACEWAPDVNCP
ncbi:hypothetical protein MHI43_24565 [Paenibacillus sp. FSL H8-0457]|nr:hypothetical protein [Paenibacillus sp. FSL H8-457]ETT68564.1 hypothetical protein C172_02487 [Paenibacillus sp. FSL H8-457]